MELNFIAVFVAALIPMALGFAWYHPKVLGAAWMKECGFTEEDLKGGNMGIIFGVSFILSLLLAFEMNFITVHQNHVYSSLMDAGMTIDDPTSALGMYYADFMANYGTNFRTFKHGAFHGILTGIFFILPVLGTNALFERKGWRYILINVGYWTVCIALMGGIVCAWI